MKIFSKKDSIVHLVGFVLLAMFFSACPPNRSPHPSTQQGPVQPTYFEHVVKFQGETLAVIAGWYTGKSQNWKLILDANPGLRPEAMRIGQIIRIPRQLMTTAEPFPKELIKRAAPVTPAPAIDKAWEGLTPEEQAVEKGIDAGTSLKGESDDSTPPTVATTPPVDAPAGTTAGVTPPPQDDGAGKPAAGGDDAERERLLKELLGQ